MLAQQSLQIMLEQSTASPAGTAAASAATPPPAAVGTPAATPTAAAATATPNGDSGGAAAPAATAAPAGEVVGLDDERLAAETCLEFELPRGAMSKVLAKHLPGSRPTDGVHAALSRAGGLFALYLTGAAVEICKSNKRQTISPQDVIIALKHLNFDSQYVNDCASYLERDRELRPKHAPTLKKYRGVYQGSINAWYSQISIAGQPIHLGSFAAPEDAARAYDRAIWSKLGTAAASLLNFPEDIPESLPFLAAAKAEAAAAGPAPPK